MASCFNRYHIDRVYPSSLPLPPGYANECILVAPLARDALPPSGSSLRLNLRSPYSHAALPYEASYEHITKTIVDL
jgi:hypothetical protein